MNLLFFDLQLQTHLPEYLRALIAGWSGRERVGTLYLLVHPYFLDEHTDLIAQANRAPCSNIRFLTLTAEEKTEWTRLSAQPGGTTLSFTDLLAGKVFDTILKYRVGDCAVAMLSRLPRTISFLGASTGILLFSRPA